MVGRELEFVDSLGERFLLAGLQVKPPERRLTAPGRPLGRTDTHAADVIDLPVAARRQACRLPRLDRQRDDPSGDPIQVDHNGFLLVGRLLLGFRHLFSSVESAAPGIFAQLSGFST